MFFFIQDLLDEENGYYNAQDDTITLEVHVVAEEPQFVKEEEEQDGEKCKRAVELLFGLGASFPLTAKTMGEASVPLSVLRLRWRSLH